MIRVKQKKHKKITKTHHKESVEIGCFCFTRVEFFIHSNCTCYVLTKYDEKLCWNKLCKSEYLTIFPLWVSPKQHGCFCITWKTSPNNTEHQDSQKHRLHLGKPDHIFHVISREKKTHSKFQESQLFHQSITRKPPLPKKQRLNSLTGAPGCLGVWLVSDIDKQLKIWLVGWLCGWLVVNYTYIYTLYIYIN